MWTANESGGKVQCYRLIVSVFAVALLAVTNPVNGVNIGDRVWWDIDCDGIQDLDENLGVPGATIHLFWFLDEKCSPSGCSGTPTPVYSGSNPFNPYYPPITATTDADGHYEIHGPWANVHYLLLFVLPAGMRVTFTVPYQGVDDHFDSNVTVSPGDPSVGWTECAFFLNVYCPTNEDNGDYCNCVWDNPDVAGYMDDCSFDAGVCPVGTGTPGYWKNHLDAWPVSEIMIGGATFASADAVYLMMMKPRGDKSLNMFAALVSAKLNALGNPSSCVADCLVEADNWMMSNPVGSGVSADSMEWKGIEDCYKRLDDYNNGLLCAPHRD